MSRSILTAIVRAFRRVALPLAWYYMVTLAIPLANGAAQAGATFVRHALVVIVAPPVLIVLACAVYECARWLARACRRRGLPAKAAAARSYRVRESRSGNRTALRWRRSAV